MRPQKIDDTKLLEGLMSILREKGYNGASLNDLAKVSGLKKASLYHRFPGGKKDIGLAVLRFVESWKQQHIIAVAGDQSIPPSERLSTIIKNVKAIYSDGECSCVMKALSLGEGQELFSDELQSGAQSWLAALTSLGSDFGDELEVAQQKAMQVLVKIQGSLVVSRNLKQTQPFAQAMEEIQALYYNQ